MIKAAKQTKPIRANFRFNTQKRCRSCSATVSSLIETLKLLI